MRITSLRVSLTAILSAATSLVGGCHATAPAESSSTPAVVPPSAGSGRVNLDDPAWAATSGDLADPSELAIWASPYVANAGDTLTVFANARGGSDVDFVVDRIGWYSGQGAHRVWSQESHVNEQPPCSPAYPGPVECPWASALKIELPADLQDGLYFVRGTSSSGKVAYYPFVIRANKPHDFLVVIPQFTWQAYNAFGGSDLYTRDPAGELGHFVSFDRPYVDYGGATFLLGDFASHELQVIRYLERSGYDVGYASDLDLTEAAPRPPVPSRAVLFAGHDEYWTSGEYDLVRSLRAAGTHLAFFAGNNIYWHIRLAPGGVTGVNGARIVCYKSASDPGAATQSDLTVRFRDPLLNRPENELIGIMYGGLAGPGFFPLIAVSQAANTEGAAFMASAGFAPGDAVPNVVGHEGDAPAPNGDGPSDLQVLFRSPNKQDPVSATADFNFTTFYVAPSGAGVFAAGNTEWARGLDNYPGGAADPRLQHLTDAVLQWMLAH